MPKTRVSVESCRSSQEQIQLMVVAWGKQMVNGKQQEVPLGEKSLSFPGDTKPADMLDAIREAGEQIEEAANQAKGIREELNKLLEKKVPK